VAVFTAIAIPIVTVGYIRDGALSLTYTLVGIALGLIAGLIVGLWVDSRGGEVWRGPRL
jgi:ABC-type nitrate/sulfonate/bicarbonate transport system permease component